MLIPSEVSRLAAQGALFIVNHSGGKDSQAMFHVVRAHVPARQLLVVHAELPEVDWPGTLDHVSATIGDTPLLVARASKTFFEMVDRRGMFPAPAQRQCTSDLKRGPIHREVRRFLKAHPEFGGRVVSCMGLRAEESPGRAKAPVFARNERESVAGREWYEWLPIHDFSTTEAFATIRAAGQEPHWAYGAGMSRLSCVFCIMAGRADLRRAAELMPDLYRRYVETERRLGRSMLMPKKGESAFLEDVTGVRLPPASRVA